MRAITAAQANVVRFAVSNGLGSGLGGLNLRAIMIFATKAGFGRAIISADGLPAGTTLPATFVGVVDDGVLYACDERAAGASNPAVASRSDYVMLLTHELTHALHIAMLKGDEAAMRPRWFYEGLAAFAADHFPDVPSASPSVYQEAVSGQSAADYRLYVAAFRRLAAAYPVADLIERTRRPDFQQ